MSVNIKKIALAATVILARDFAQQPSVPAPDQSYLGRIIKILQTVDPNKWNLEGIHVVPGINFSGAKTQSCDFHQRIPDKETGWKWADFPYVEIRPDGYLSITVHTGPYENPQTEKVGLLIGTSSSVSYGHGNIFVFRDATEDEKNAAKNAVGKEPFRKCEEEIKRLGPNRNMQITP